MINISHSWGSFKKMFVRWVGTSSSYVRFSRTNATLDARRDAGKRKAMRAQRNSKQCNSLFVRSVRGFYDGLTGRTTHLIALWKTPQVSLFVLFRSATGQASNLQRSKCDIWFTYCSSNPIKRIQYTHLLILMTDFVAIEFWIPYLHMHPIDCTPHIFKDAFPWQH